MNDEKRHVQNDALDLDDMIIQRSFCLTVHDLICPKTDEHSLGIRPATVQKKMIVRSRQIGRGRMGRAFHSTRRQY